MFPSPKSGPAVVVTKEGFVGQIVGNGGQTGTEVDIEIVVDGMSDEDEVDGISDAVVVMSGWVKRVEVSTTWVVVGETVVVVIGGAVRVDTSGLVVVATSVMVVEVKLVVVVRIGGGTVTVGIVASEEA